MDEVLNAGRRQVLYGIAWCVAGTVALFYTFGTTGSGFIWYGAFLGSIVHWYRALVLYRASIRLGWRVLRGSDLIVVAAALALVLGSVRLLVPEYDRISNPQVGSCFADSDDGNYFASVACWSDKAVYKAVSWEPTFATCGTEFSTSASMFGKSGVLCVGTND